MKKNWYLIAGILLSAGMARADLYDVPPIAIAAEGTSAQEARRIAIANGQAEAFWRLLGSMVDPEDMARVSLPAADTLQDLVQNVSLSDEKNTPTKYKANLSVRFHPEKIQAFLIERQIPYLTQEMPKTLVVPVFSLGDEVWMLEETNPVFAFLKAQLPENSFVLPVGDLEEIALARAAWADDDLTALMPLATKYEAARVLVWQVEQRGPYVTGQTHGTPPAAELPDVTADAVAPTGVVADVLPDLWQQVAHIQTESWRTAKTNDLSAPNLMWVKVPISGLKEWVTIQKQLARSGEDIVVTVRGFRPNEVLLTFSTRLPTTDVAVRMEKFGFDLDDAGADVWQLTQHRPKEAQWQSD